MKHESLLKENKEGWGRFYTGRTMSHKFHYFNNSPTPICGKRSYQTHIPVLINEVAKKDCCNKCWDIKHPIFSMSKQDR